MFCTLRMYSLSLDPSSNWPKIALNTPERAISLNSFRVSSFSCVPTVPKTKTIGFLVLRSLWYVFASIIEKMGTLRRLMKFSICPSVSPGPDKVYCSPL